MNTFVLGGSRNIGYLSALRFLSECLCRSSYFVYQFCLTNVSTENGQTVTFLLRSPSVFDGDEDIQPYVKSGKARLVKGDALDVNDVRRGWEAASEGGKSRVDIVLSSVGQSYRFYRLALELTAALLRWRRRLQPMASRHHHHPVQYLHTRHPEHIQHYPRLSARSRDPASLHHPFRARSTTQHFLQTPFWLKFLHGFIVRIPHADKLGVERITSHLAGWEWNEPEPRADILDPKTLSNEGEWSSLPGRGELKHVVVVRPGVLTDGECQADKVGVTAPYRVTATSQILTPSRGVTLPTL